jgi:hypothetical protein
MYINKVLGLPGADSGKPTSKDKATSTSSGTSNVPSGYQSGSEGEDRNRPYSTNTEYTPKQGDSNYTPPVITKQQTDFTKPLIISLVILKILHII